MNFTLLRGWKGARPGIDGENIEAIELLHVFIDENRTNPSSYQWAFVNMEPMAWQVIVSLFELSWAWAQLAVLAFAHNSNSSRRCVQVQYARCQDCGKKNGCVHAKFMVTGDKVATHVSTPGVSDGSRYPGYLPVDKHVYVNIDIHYL